MLFILNKNYEVVESLNDRGNMAVITPYFDDEYLQDLATGAETFTFSTLGDSIQSQHIVVGNFIAFRHKDEYKLFNIINVDEEHTDIFIKTVYCEMASIELINDIVRPIKFSGTVRSFINTVLNDTSWKLGRIDMGLTQSVDIDLTDYKSAYSLLQEYVVNNFGAELSYRVEIKNNKIVGKYVDVYIKRGMDRGLRFAYTKNLTSIKRTIDTSNIATALIGIGNSNITFKELDLPDKPAGQDFIVSESAYKIWNVNGHHIMGTFKTDTDSPQELLKLTRKELEKRSVPQTKYEMKVELLGEEVEIGDTVKIVDHGFNPPIYLEGRVNQLKISKTDPTRNECVLANFKEIGTNISAELKELAGYVDSKFPIGTNDIKDGAINGDKLHNGAIIQGTHLFANSVTADKIMAGEIKTDHLSAGSVTADKVTTGELITTSAQIAQAIIGSAHIKEGTIDTIHINDGSITSAKIGDAQIGTAQIKDAEITVAKIQDAFVDSLVAKQGKFESAHIGVLTSDNIDANTITAEHITSSVIDAINMSVSGTIDASKINVKDLVVDNIDAGSIVSGTIDADRINGSVISAINASIENAKIDSAKIGDLSADKITSGTISTDILSSNVISAINASIDVISADRIDVSSIVVDEIDAGKIVSGTVDADRITGSVVQAINLSAGKIDAKNINVEGLKVGGANIIEGSIVSAHIGTGQINTAHIDKAFVADAFIKNLDASKITAGTLDTSRVVVSSTSGNLIMRNNTIQIVDTNRVTRVQLGEDATGDYGLIIQNANGEVMWDLTGASAKGIQDGAVVNDKIKDNEITANKLVIESIWANEAFISNFQSANIDAGQITTGKISGDRIDINGLISFDTLDEEMKENFQVVRDPNTGEITKTWINGSNIVTGSVTADKINTRGFTAEDELGNVTFNIDAVTGEVNVKGNISSINYEEGKEGYRLQPNGTAEFNDTIVRGSVILPSAGITDFGSDKGVNNLALGTSEKMTANLTGNDNQTFYKYNLNSLSPNKKTTISFKYKLDAKASTNIPEGRSAGVYFQASGKYTDDTSIWHGKSGGVDIDLNKTTGVAKINVTLPSKQIAQWKFGIRSNFLVGSIEIWDVMFVEGEDFPEWKPAKEDKVNHVRFWAGADYENRDKAPFKVLEDGSIIATKGEFGGVFSGKVNIGNIFIQDDNKSEGSIEIKNNDNSQTFIRLNEKSSYFKSNLSIGTDFVNFDTTGKIMDVKGQANFTNGSYSTTLNNGNTILGTTDGKGLHRQFYWDGCYNFSSNGNQQNKSDFRFEKNNATSSVKVDIMGEMYVKDKITMNNNIAIVARQDTGNSGFDYVVK